MPSRWCWWHHPSSRSDQGAGSLSTIPRDCHPDAASCPRTASAAACAGGLRAALPVPPAPPHAAASSPSVTPVEPMVPLQVLVEVLHVPTPVLAAILIEHPSDLVHRHPPERSFAKPLVSQTSKPVFLVTISITAELPLRDPQQLSSFQTRQFLPLPSAQYIPEFFHPAIL